VTAGGALTYTLVVTNAGPSTAENVVLVDDLPEELAVVEINASQGSCTAARSFRCGLGTLAADATAQVSVTVRTDASTAGGTVLNNQAWVSSDVLDDDNGDNFDTTPVLATVAADLWIQKTREPASSLHGDVVYTIVAGNDGPSDAPSSMISDTIPVELASVTWECTGFDGALCPSNGDGNLRAAADLPDGGRVLITLQGQLVGSEALTNRAEVLPSPAITDPYSPNNRASACGFPETTVVYLPIMLR